MTDPGEEVENCRGVGSCVWTECRVEIDFTMIHEPLILEPGPDCDHCMSSFDFRFPPPFLPSLVRCSHLILDNPKLF